MNRKKILIAALAAALVCLALARPAYYGWRALGYYWGEPTQAERTVMAYAREHHVPYGKYPQALVDFLETSPEAVDFVLNFPFRQAADPDVTGADRQTVPLFLQWDPRWGYERYGGQYLAVTGCGPTALAMAGYYLTGDPAMNPLDVARFAEKQGYYAPGYGSSWTLISEGAGRLGLEAKELPLVKKKITAALEAGHPVILALGPGDFTTAGHYVVLTGLEDGGFRLNDPNSPARSAQLWTYETLEHQIRNIWEISVQ